MWIIMLLGILWFGTAVVATMFACALSAQISADLSPAPSVAPLLEHESEDFENEYKPCFGRRE